MDKKKGRSNLKKGILIAALVAALALFAAMLGLEKKMLEDYEKGTVVVAVQKIDKGKLLGPEQAETYLAYREVDQSCIPESALTSMEEAEGKMALFNIPPGVMLTGEMLAENEEVLRRMRSPIIAGCAAEDLSQIVGGVLRAGDRIHIYTVGEEGETRLLWQNVYVQQVFDQSGTIIPGEDRTLAAQRMNIYLEKEDAERFFAELAAGSLRVAKVCE